MPQTTHGRSAGLTFARLRWSPSPKGPSMINEDDIRAFKGILTGVVITACGSAIIWLGFVSLR